MKLSPRTLTTLALLSLLYLDLPRLTKPASLFADGPDPDKPLETRASHAFATALARGSRGVQQTLSEHVERSREAAAQRHREKLASIEHARLLTKATTLLAHGLVEDQVDDAADVAENEKALMGGQGHGSVGSATLGIDGSTREDDEKDHVVALLSATLLMHEDKDSEGSAELLLDYQEEEGGEGGGEGGPGMGRAVPVANGTYPIGGNYSGLDFIDDMDDVELEAYLSGFVTIDFPGASPLDFSEDFLDGLPHQGKDMKGSSHASSAGGHHARPEHGALKEEGVTGKSDGESGKGGGVVEGEAAGESGEAVLGVGIVVTPEEQEEAELELIYTGIL
eukprot:jgi/Mesvir1/15836/Mv03386-RA.1